MEKAPCVYMLASHRNGTLYVGVTSDLIKRIHEHRNSVIQGFTKKYGVHSLVWYERHIDMRSAIEREKKAQEIHASCGSRLIETENPEWHDLWPEVIS